MFGATGVLGRGTIPHLVGHAVAGTTRSADKAAALAVTGTEAFVCDAYEADSVARVARAFRPDVVVNFLTDLAGGRGPGNSRIRRQAAPNVTAAARAAGARRLVVESIAFPTTPDSDAAVAAMERDAEASGLETLILRFGRFWGRGTWSVQPADPPAIEIGEAGRRAAAFIVGSTTGITLVAGVGSCL
jgi:nucleoside-diphosphate-sugar epimerase